MNFFYSMKRRTIFIIIGVILLIIVGYVIYAQQTKQVSALPFLPIGKSASEENVFVVKKTTLKNTLTLSGDIDAYEKATLAFQMGGRLSWVGVKEGDYVKKYQGIASLDVRRLQQDISKTLNNYMTTRWNFEQTKQDNKEAQYKDGDIGDKMKRLIDIAQFGLNNSVLDVEIATLAKEYAYLWTPIEGVVTHMGAKQAGVNIPVSTTFEVVNPKSVYFAMTADQTEIPKLSVGQVGEIIFDAYPEETVSGTISSIAFVPKAGETSTVYEVQVDFPSSENLNKYRIGMTGDITFILDEKMNILTVPSANVKTEGTKKYVMVLREGKPEKVYVVIGEENDGESEVISGLKVGDRIVEPK